MQGAAAMAEDNIPAGDAPEATAQQDPAGPELGEAGQKALVAERQKAKDALRQLRDVQAELKRFQEAEQAKADADKSEAERRAAAEARAEAADLRALRLEVAFAKGLTPGQAKRLVGSSREELEADADEIVRDFPVTAAPPAAKPSPKPDRSQGSRGSESSMAGSVASGADLYAQKNKPKTNVT